MLYALLLVQTRCMLPLLRILFLFLPSFLLWMYVVWLLSQRPQQELWVMLWMPRLVRGRLTLISNIAIFAVTWDIIHNIEYQLAVTASWGFCFESKCVWSCHGGRGNTPCYGKRWTRGWTTCKLFQTVTHEANITSSRACALLWRCHDYCQRKYHGFTTFMISTISHLSEIHTHSYIWLHYKNI